MQLNDKKIYDKGNSIIQMRIDDQYDQNLISRLKKISDDYPNLDANDPLSLAFDDIFSRKNENKITDFHLREHVIEEISKLRDCEIARYLRYRYQYDVYPVKKILSKYPPVVQIEPTSICNYRCVFCYQTDKKFTDKKNGHMGSMDLELFKKIINELEGNVESISLASRGEPTVNKDLGKMLQYMDGKFLASKLNTNAYLLDENLSRIILNSNLQTLVFSADAASEPLYSKLRVNGNLDRVLKNIEKFHELKSKEYPQSTLITRVSGVKFSGNQDFKEMNKFWGRYVDQVAFVDYNPWENVYNAEKNGIDTPCSDLWRRLFVWWDGRISPCDVDYMTTLVDYNIKDNSLSQIWTSKNYQDLRMSHLEKKRQCMNLCSRCVVV